MSGPREIGEVALVMDVEPLWRTLPATPSLPTPSWAGHASVNGIDIWHAAFGAGDPVILLHGGLAHADYWGHQVPALATRHLVVVMDSRGHGRSSRDERPFDYHLMATDVVGLMDVLNIAKAAIVGWSDGANVGLDLVITHPARVSRLFAFAANADPSGQRDTSDDPVFDAYLARAANEYARLSRTPEEYRTFLAEIGEMWATQPRFTTEQLNRIAVPTWVVAAEHDEAIAAEHARSVADRIPGAVLLVQPGVSHFSFLQAPQQFNDDVLRFLAETQAPRRR